jgi:hypothetical protein
MTYLSTSVSNRIKMKYINNQHMKKAKTLILNLENNKYKYL